MHSDILKLINDSGASRQFINKKIPDKLFLMIIEAGRWGYSILGIQPWTIVGTTRKDLIGEIADITFQRSLEIPKPFGLILRLTSQTIRNAPGLIAIYNNKKVSLRTEKYGEPYFSKARVAELQAMGGAIQNMLLEASSLGFGAVWLDSPTFFDSDKINKVLDKDAELVALIVLGYPMQRTKRSKRSDYKDMISIIK